MAVPLLVASHEAHEAVKQWARGRTLALSGHALAETYSVLTRLPGDARLTPADAVVLIDENFARNVALPPEAASAAHRDLARLGIAGGAAYDGLVALAAQRYDLMLATRDARARSTYEAVGVRVAVVPGG
ncbi:PIN domain-containing protein [Microbacterium sp.]|uniref:PIN domain-containing protein n=1 Tax=Microbacterium sp. TaxID=51671 RepID=UPI0039E5E1A8